MWMKNSPDGLLFVSCEETPDSKCLTNGSVALRCILFLYCQHPYMMPAAVVKAASELKDANIIVEVLTDLDWANFSAFVKAAVAVAVAFGSVASW